jgi:hypothetical protein
MRLLHHKNLLGFTMKYTEGKKIDWPGNPKRIGSEYLKGIPICFNASETPLISCEVTQLRPSVTKRTSPKGLKEKDFKMFFTRLTGSPLLCFPI